MSGCGPEDWRPSLWHVTSSLNRDSIRQFGLDWQRMGVARGIAGSTEPEQQGCFVCRDDEDVEWFLRMNNTGGPVDVWEVTEADPTSLVESPEGYYFLPGAVPPAHVRLVQQDLLPDSG